MDGSQKVETSLKTSAQAGFWTALAVLVAMPIVGVAAQASGDGYLFHAPYGSLSLRGGYELANTSSEPFGIMRRQTTIGARSFDALNLGADLGFNVTRRFDVVVSLDASSRATTAEYRDWEENGQPIEHWSGLDRLGLAANVRYNLKDRGRSISSLAWIPARVVPYVGVGAGMMWHVLIQKGDFVEETAAQTASIFNDELRTSNRSVLAQAFTGLDYRINARWSVLGEARYAHSSSTLRADYTGLGKINLSGVVMNVGTSVRF